MGDLRQAKDFHKQGLDIYTKRLGPEHVYVTTCCDNLGLVLRQLGDSRQAKECHERKLGIKLKNLGP